VLHLARHFLGARFCLKVEGMSSVLQALIVLGGVSLAALLLWARYGGRE
jgi:hypothetical protein